MMNDGIHVDVQIEEEKLKKILVEMIYLERNNNKKEEFTDVQMVDKLLKVLEDNL